MPAPAAPPPSTALLTRLQALAVALAPALSIERVTEALVREAIATADAVAGALALLTDDAATFELLHSFGYPPDVLAHVTRLPATTEWPIGEVARTGRAVYLASLAEWVARYPNRPMSVHDGGDGAWAALPLVGRRDDAPALVGVLTLTFAAPRAFAAEECAFLEALAQHGALALDRARLYEAAQAASQARLQFLAAASHELRTPLTTIIGYAELLADGMFGPVPGAMHDPLTHMRAAAEQLHVLVGDMLSYARLSTGTLRPRLEVCRLEDLVADAVRVSRPLLERKGLALRLTAPERGVELVTDCGMVHQILLNLVDNAVKFTDSGDVAITVDGDELWARVAVHDTGRGIATEHLARIFDPLWQVDQRHTRVAGGLGIGLTLARDLAGALGGGLRVRSAVGEGSTFEVWFPRELGALPADAAVAAAPAADAPGA